MFLNKKPLLYVNYDLLKKKFNIHNKLTFNCKPDLII